VRNGESGEKKGEDEPAVPTDAACVDGVDVDVDVLFLKRIKCVKGSEKEDWCEEW